MDSRLKNSFLSALSLLMMSMILVACQDTIPQRGLITPDAAIGNTGGTSGGDSGEEKNKRPDGAVKFKLDFCGCKDGKAVTYGNCNTFCAGKNTDGVGLLYANFNVTEAISLNSGLGNLYAWCNTPLPDEEANPRCVIKAKDENGGEQILDVVGASGSNSLTANIDKLSEDKAYVLTLVEQTSGAKSDSIQIVKFSADIPLPVLGPLKNAPISQYSCIHRPPAPDDETGDIYYDVAFRVHFYFLPRIPPQPIAAGSDIVCHDWLNPLYGAIDDILFPRLELIGGVFNLWDNTDPRFYDNNGNGNEDVNDIIIQKAKNFGLPSSFPASAKFFIPFPTMSTSDDNEEAGNNNSAQSLGFYMPPWTDQTTFRSYCLNSSHYNSSNPLFKAMRDVVGVDMEGIYVGVKAPETVFDRDNMPVQAPNDFILVRETDLKKVWFYMKNNVPTVPTDAVVSSVPVFFYYPLNPASPYVKTSSQRIYQVKGAVELNNSEVPEGGTNANGISTKYPPHDRKIGCIPKF